MHKLPPLGDVQMLLRGIGRLMRSGAKLAFYNVLKDFGCYCRPWRFVPFSVTALSIALEVC